MLDYILDKITISLPIILPIIILICSTIIYWRSDKAFRLSEHEGIKYFRNTFGAFAIMMISNILSQIVTSKLIILFLYSINRAALIMASLYFIYSLIWKRINLKGAHNQLLMIMAYLFAILLGIIQALDGVDYAMPLIPLIAFGASVLIIAFSKPAQNRIIFMIAAILLFCMTIIIEISAWNNNPLFNILSSTFILVGFLIILFIIIKRTRGL